MNKLQLQCKLDVLKVPNDKLSQTVFDLSAEDYKDFERGEWIDIIENPRGKLGKQVTTPFKLKYSGGFNDAKPLAILDRMIFSVCYSAYRKGWRGITVNQICHFLTHGANDENTQPTPALTDTITESVKRLMATTIEIDLSETAKKMNYPFKRTKIIAPLLPCKLETWEVNGQEVQLITFFDENPLAEIAEAKNQIMTVSAKLFDVAGIRNTPQVMTLKGYLVTRISAMKQHPKNLSNSITYADIYARIGAADAPKSSKQRIRAEILAIMESLKSEGIIRNFEVVKHGCAYHSIKIKL